VRYSDAQPTRATKGDIDAMALYAGASVELVRNSATAEEITVSIMRGLR
jgi:hypothetical protein